MDKHIIILDVGTQSLRAILYNKNGDSIFMAQKRYNSVQRGIEVEQDPRTWKNNLIDTLSEVSDFAKANNIHIGMISVTSQRASIIPITKHGKYLYNAITWQDRRSYQQSNSVKEKMTMKDIYIKTGLRLDSYFSAPKMMWLKQNMSDIYDEAYKIIGVQDYIVHILTNRFVTDYTQAARTLLMNITSFSWDEQLLNVFEIEKEKLPEIVPPGTVVGTLSDFVVLKTKLDHNIEVMIAGGDQQCAAIGLNVLKPGSLEANIGTGSFVIAYTDKPVFDEGMRILCSASAVPGKWIVEAGLLTSGNIYSWFREQFYQKGNQDNIYHEINQEVNASVPGSKGLILIPHFKGSAAPYWNPLSKGVFFNATLEHTRGDYARCILEGIAMEMGENISLMENLIGYVDIIYTAGGLTKFDTFNQIQSDVYNKAVSVYKNSEATAFGALISTLVSIGDYSNHSNAFDNLSRNYEKRTFHTISKNIPIYHKLKRIKKHLYNAINDSHVYNYMTMR